jgi:Fic family protein
MENLHARFAETLRDQKIDQLILDSLYVPDFLCVHPFSDGNGRIARLLTVMLLHKQGFEVGRFISLERLIEQTKESYYDTLYRSSQGWHESRHDPMPWIAYLLSVVHAAYNELAGRVEELQGHRGAKTAYVLQAIREQRGDFSVSELRHRIPSVGVDLIRKVLKDEKAAGRVVSLGRGRAARWRKADQSAAAN